METELIEEQPGTAQEREGLHLAELSNAIVRLYKHHFGRGPTKVRTSYAGPDTLVCVLEETFTTSERKLADWGEHQRLRETRALLAGGTERELVKAVEQITGRSVRSYLSGIDPERDTSCELFLLAPQASQPE